MPPKKDKLTKAKLRDLTLEHGIRMKGPVPPREWPEQHKHHFQAVRTIEDLRYDTYMYTKNPSVSRAQRNEYKLRVQALRSRAYDLLDDVGANETTWRDLEIPIFQIFEKDVLCRYCKMELWKPYLEAECLHERSRLQLLMERGTRQMCNCDKKHVRKDVEARHQNGPIFDSAADGIVRHAPDDDLDTLTISMKPDRVIGLRPWTRMPQNEAFSPVSGRPSLLLPFLVVEAKGEQGGSGFRAIQHQTAFPIRRFLKSQNEMMRQDPSCEPPLVWFFAYQGELWRLHACTQDDDKVRIYDLWQGSIQSQDGALQLLLLVEYIWSWARDIYRPTIQNLHASFLDRSCGFSPASTDRFRHSISLSCESSLPNSQEQDQVQFDQLMLDRDDGETPADDVHFEIPRITASTVENASLDPLLRWAKGHHDSPSWTQLGTIHHANMVRFEVRYSEITGVNPARSTETLVELDDSPALNIPLSSFLHVLPAQIEQIAKLWTPNGALIQKYSPDLVLHTTILFHTFCDRETWQIKKVLHFVVWEPCPANRCAAKINKSENDIPLPKSGFIDHMLDQLFSLRIPIALTEVKQMGGRQCVWNALKHTCLTLQKTPDGGLAWTRPETYWLPDEFDTFDIVLELPFKSDLHLKARMHHPSGISNVMRIRNTLPKNSGCGNIPWSDEFNMGSSYVTLPDLERDVQKGNSMLAIRPPAWPEDSPQFCLFILENEFEDNESTIHRLLEEAVSLGNFYGDSSCRWTRSTSETLWKWRKALGHGRS